VEEAASVAGAALAGGALVGLGLDLVEVARFAAALARYPKMGERLFTPAERGYAGGFADPAPSLAARFAAKEAVMKALGVGLGAFAFPEVEVERHASGQPYISLHGSAEDLASRRGVRQWLVSLTHTETTAAAVVVAIS
jgi:holo-[acyl-carrier protein] synthase